MKHFDIGTRTLVRFGEGVRHELVERMPSDGSAQILLIASERALRRDPLPRLLEELRSRGSLHIWTKVQPNPRVEDIDECVKHHRRQNISHIVGIGGGSAMDQAKATAIALSCGTGVADLLASGGVLSPRNNKLFLLPTTSGTGAELSYGAILTNASSGEKLGLRGVAQAADVALVDPELTYSLPMYTSMETGFDVLTHALETAISLAATPYTIDHSRSALERVFRWLPVLHDDLSNTEARREMSYASMLMGQNLALSTTCLPHRLQYPIGAATDTAHAAGLAALYPAWISHLLPHATSRLARCARWIGVGEDASTELQRASAFADEVGRLMERINFQPKLRDLGVDASMLANFPDQVSGKLETDPSYSSREDLVSIYNQAYGR